MSKKSSIFAADLVFAVRERRTFYRKYLIFRRYGAALRDEELYQLLVIADTLRMGRSREKEIAIAELNKHIQRYVEIEGGYYEDPICE